MSGTQNESWQKLFGTLALPVGLSAAALGAVYFLRKFGIIYQLFHKVRITDFDMSKCLFNTEEYAYPILLSLFPLPNIFLNLIWIVMPLMMNLVKIKILHRVLLFFFFILGGQ